ncbi:MAG: tRNA (adenosine(37)-N6)-threonylcarbamoyltransferase complex dimerization subunit type 1 TsaB [Pseudomonadota bacterium]
MNADRNILAIDTAGPACSVAIQGTSRGVLWRHEPMTKGHAERLFPMINDVMGEAGLTLKDLDAIAVTTGPGSFTGVRVGVAAARGLALATQLQTVTATSLATTARLAATELERKGVRAASDDSITVIQDARRGNLFVQDFDVTGCVALSKARLHPVEDSGLLRRPDQDQIFTGSGVELLQQSPPEWLLQVKTVDVTADMPTAVALTEVDLLEMQPVRPLYLRPPDAKAQDGKSLLRQSR